MGALPSLVGVLTFVAAGSVTRYAPSDGVMVCDEPSGATSRALVLVAVMTAVSSAYPRAHIATTRSPVDGRENENNS